MVIGAETFNKGTHVNTAPTADSMIVNIKSFNFALTTLLWLKILNGLNVIARICVLMLYCSMLCAKHVYYLNSQALNNRCTYVFIVHSWKHVHCTSKDID